MVLNLVPQAAKQPHNCDETFQLSLKLFKKLADTSIGLLNLDELVGQWSTLLLLHTPNEVCSNPRDPMPLTYANDLVEHWTS